MKKVLAAFLACFLVGCLAFGASAETLPEDAWISASEVEACGINEDVSAKVAEIAKACRDAGVTGEYDIALWLHDWLIYNANYDYSYTYYGPEGVLLYGKGVCASYTTAYRLLLNAFGIENEMLNASEMNHAWNLVKIDGEWCHVDCTWDDPSGGNGENRQYFGLNDAMMKRDHEWNYAAYRTTESLRNNYCVRNHQGGVTQEEINECLNFQLEQGLTTLEITYLGDDPNFDILDSYQCWMYTYNWKYGLSGCRAKISGYHASLTMRFTEPWEKPEEYTYPVTCPDFTLSSPYGRYSLSSYRNNGLVLIFGRDYNMNSRHLTDRLTAELAELHSQGVEVILSALDVTNPDEMAAFQEQYPGFSCTYGDSDVMNSLCMAMGSNNGSQPQVFVIDKNGMIVNYAAGFNTKLDETIRKIHDVATGAAIPGPTKPEIHSTVNADLLAGAVGDTARQLAEIAKQNKGTLFLQIYNAYFLEQQLEAWESNAQIYQRLGMKLAVCSMDDCSGYQETYPDVAFLEDDGNIMWDLAYASGMDVSLGVSYDASALIDSRGYLVKYVNASYISGREAAIHFAYTAPMEAVLPADLETIEAEAFQGAALTTLDLSKSNVHALPAGAFSNCPNLTYVRLPENVTIDEGAFTGCDHLVLLCDYNTPGYRYAVEHGIDVIPRY